MNDQSESENQTSEFSYALGEKENVILLVLSGKISHREVASLEEMEAKIKEKPQTLLIVNFKKVTSVMPGVHVFFANFLKHMRDGKKNLGLCELKPELRMALASAGIIRGEEVFGNIPEASKALHSKLKKDSGEEVKNAA